MDVSDIARQTQVINQRRQRRTIQRLRIWAGVQSLFVRPWKWVFIVLLFCIFLFLWSMRAAMIQPFTNSSFVLLSTICGYAVSAAIPLLFVVFLLGLLSLLGTPFHARTIEEKLRHIRLVDRYDNPPALISYRRIKNTAASIMAFYSPGVGRERWEGRSTAIQDALNIHFVEPINYGGRHNNNRNMIILTVAPGAGGISRKGTVYDDEL